MKSVHNQVKDQPRHQVLHQVGDRVWVRVCDQYDNRVRVLYQMKNMVILDVYRSTK
jgi:hypothetical protein